MPDSQQTKKIATPKVFVPYAQSEERTSWISDICERLMHDGVDVVVDLYELPHSADIHGAHGIPAGWLAKLAMRDFITDMADELLALSAKEDA
jgi:hypothetical protein